MPNGEITPYRGKAKHSGRDYAKRIDLGEQILARRNKGESFWTIAKDLQISNDSARRYLELALASRVAPTVDLFRRQQNDRLDQTQREIETQLELAAAIGRRAYEEDPLEPNVTLIIQASAMRERAIALQLRLDERRARLNGLDSPVQAEVRVTQVDPVDAEMAEMIREAKARAAAES